MPPRSLKDYYEIIAEPLSLKGLQKQVRGQRGRGGASGVSDFKSWSQFEDQTSLLWKNAYHYNEDGSEISVLAKELEVKQSCYTMDVVNLADLYCRYMLKELSRRQSNRFQSRCSRRSSSRSLKTPRHHRILRKSRSMWLGVRIAQLDLRPRLQPRRQKARLLALVRRQRRHGIPSAVLLLLITASSTRLGACPHRRPHLALQLLVQSSLRKRPDHPPPYYHPTRL